MFLSKGSEKFSTVDAIEGIAGPIQDLDEAEWPETGGCRYLLEKIPHHGDMKRPPGGVPIELGLGPQRLLFAPLHPSREDAIEESLHKRRAEKMLALVSLELHAQSLFQARANRGQRRQLGLLLDAGKRISRI